MSEWSSQSLDNLTVKIGSGATPKGGKEAYKLEGISLIRSQNILDFTFTSNGLAFIDNDQAKKLSYVNVQEDDVLINITGDSVARVCSAPAKHLPARVNQHVAILRPSTKLNSDYLKYYLLSPRKKSELLMLASSGATRNALTKGMLENFKIDLPPLPEQKAIAHILGTLDEKIELNRQMNQTLEAMAQALFKSWFVDFDPVMDNALAAGKKIPDALKAKAEKRKRAPDSKKLLHTNAELAATFPADFVFNEVLGKWIPEGWEVKKFGELIETTIGGDWGKELPDDRHSEEVKIIRGTDIPSIINCNVESVPTRYVELKKLMTRKLEEGDIVIEVSGGSPTQSTGRSIRITSNILNRLGGIMEPASFCRRLKPINLKIGILLSEQLTYIYGIGKMWEYQNQSTGISNFQTKYFLEAEMVLVPTSVQVLESFYLQVSALKNKATSNENLALTELRDTLLPQLIIGKVKVKPMLA